jgi:hypothetical protein
MSVANTVFIPAASGISIENEYNGSAKREIGRKKPSPPIKVVCMDLTPNVPNLRTSSDIFIVYIP